MLDGFCLAVELDGALERGDLDYAITLAAEIAHHIRVLRRAIERGPRRQFNASRGSAATWIPTASRVSRPAEDAGVRRLRAGRTFGRFQG